MPQPGRQQLPIHPDATPDGTLARRTKGTPQGGPISPLIANIFLHYGFDTWMVREFPGVGFERFADAVVVHCVTEHQAQQVREAIGRRFAEIGLQLHPDKTRIVYCKDDRRRLNYGLDAPIVSSGEADDAITRPKVS